MENLKEGDIIKRRLTDRASAIVTKVEGNEVTIEWMRTPDGKLASIIEVLTGDYVKLPDIKGLPSWD